MTTLTRQFDFKNVDWTAVAAGDARDGTADLTLGAITGKIETAFLYWGELNFSGSSDNYVTMNGQPVTDTWLGTSVDTCWGSDESLGYFANVTDIVKATQAGDSAGSYAIDGMGRGGQGATLVVIYDDGDNTNNRDLTFYAGNDSTNGSGQSQRSVLAMCPTRKEM